MPCALLDLTFVLRRLLLGKSGSMPLMANRKESENIHRKMGRYGKSDFQEKLLRLNATYPYRKPTQVVSSSRARRTSERSPRNSAKKQPYVSNKVCPYANFGIVFLLPIK